MTNIAIVGAQYGDEAKGSMTHYFSPNYDWVIRWAGGANAGHTIYRDSIKYVHNLMPSFDWRQTHVKAFLGSGMVIDVEQLYKEAIKIAKCCDGAASRIYIDPEAFLVLPEHKEEDKKNNAHIGSTNRGIGPAYAAKMGRRGFRIKDILNGNISFGQNHVDALKHLGVQFKSVLELRDQFKNERLLFEGAQGVMLDINHGIYPYVSCGESTVAGIYSAGFNFIKLDKVYGIAKCYSTKVGEGPFPTEIFDIEAEELRKLGNEYGATTGRPRRVGWIDLPALKYACHKGGITNLIITKFDILNGMKLVKMCHSYDKEPMYSSDFYNAKPQYIQVAGWEDSKKIDQLSNFINNVKYYTGYETDYVSCGISSDDISSC